MSPIFLRALLVCMFYFRLVTEKVVAQDTDSQPSAAPVVPEIWSLHGQMTFVDQYHPAFKSPYSGANSLNSGSRGDDRKHKSPSNAPQEEFSSKSATTQ